MKLLLKFGGFHSFEKEIVVDWHRDVKDFPSFCQYEGRYWEAQFFDKDISGRADQILVMSEYRASALPTDINGRPFPVTDLALMFNLIISSDRACWCGTDTYGVGKHSDYCPKYEK